MFFENLLLRIDLRIDVVFFEYIKDRNLVVCVEGMFCERNMNKNVWNIKGW